MTYPDGQVVDEDEERAAGTDAVEAGEGDGAVRCYSNWYGGVVSQVELQGYEAYDDQPKDNEQGDDAAAGPGVSHATPLQGE